MSYVDLMWKAIEGGIGREKTAYIQSTPLNEIMREKVAREHGIDIDSGMGMEDAIGAIAISWRKKKAQSNKVKEGLDALKDLTRSSQTEKTASDDTIELYPKDASTHHKIAAAYKLRRLEDLAEGENTEKLAHLRKQTDKDVIKSLKKEANILGAISRNPAARNVGKGMAVGTGAAVPLYAGGSALSDRFTEDARDRALETAAGTAAIGVGTYGLGRTIDHGLEQRAQSNNLQRALKAQSQVQRSSSPSLREKGGSVGSAENGAVENFKAAVYLDELLGNAKNTEKVAAVRERSRKTAVDQLCNSYKKQARDHSGQRLPPALSKKLREIGEKRAPEGLQYAGSTRNRETGKRQLIHTQDGTFDPKNNPQHQMMAASLASKSS